jgi:hypothetical protein
MRNGTSLAGDAARPSIKAPGSAMRLPVFLLTELRNLNKGTDGVEPPAAGRRSGFSNLQYARQRQTVPLTCVHFIQLDVDLMVENSCYSSYMSK